METTAIEPLKLAVRSLYDAQKLRIEMSNRISADVRSGVLSPEWEVRLADRMERMLAVEKDLGKDVAALVKDHDIWPWLESVKGCGPAMSAVLISEVQDPARFATVSKLWAYSGLHVIDGRAARRKKGVKANWNSFLKTKLLGVLAKSFVIHGGDYRKIYDDEKHRLANKPCSMSPEEHNKKFGQALSETQRELAGHVESETQGVRAASQAQVETQSKAAPKQKLQSNGCTLSHMDNKAKRKAVKIFLMDFYVAWNTIRGNDIRPSYAEEFLGKVHSA